MSNLIKVINKEKANELIESGFNYMLDYFNNEKIHVFLATSELMEYINLNLDIQDYIISERIKI